MTSWSRDGGDFALVLDDYHVITADSIQRGMTFLLEHLPPQLHLILATRADPPLPLARLRAQGQLSEVRAADLRFGTAEASAFLQAVMGLDLPPEAIATLEQPHGRLDCWPATGRALAAGQSRCLRVSGCLHRQSSLCARLPVRRGARAATRSGADVSACTPVSWNASADHSAMR